MKKNALKYLTDAALFVDLCAIAATGFILGVVVPPGQGGGRFIGLPRHAWGDIHGNLAVILLLLLGLHVYLNWSWVRSTSSRILGRHWRRTLLFVSGAWVVLLFLCWLLALIFW